MGVLVQLVVSEFHLWKMGRPISGVLGYGEAPFCDLCQQVRFGLNVI